VGPSPNDTFAQVLRTIDLTSILPLRKMEDVRGKKFNPAVVTGLWACRQTSRGQGPSAHHTQTQSTADEKYPRSTG